MSCVFLQKGNTFSPTDPDKLNVCTVLPNKTFNIFQDDHGNFHFNVIDDFDIPTKLYGDTNKTASKILNTFAVRSSSTGVLLSGTKGSGKSLLAKTLSVKGAELDYPTIVINRPWRGDDFNKLIQDIAQPCIVLFDEFEKIYDKEEQEELLTLLDGVYNSKKLFVITCNNVYRVDNHMINRPGRIFYKKSYKGLHLDFIREYCEENLNDKQFIEKICTISSLFEDFNFDMLKALVEEMNRYEETPEQALELLNVTPEGEQDHDFHVQLFVNGVEIKDRLRTVVFSGKPLRNAINIAYEKDPEDEYDYDYARFTGADLVAVDAKSRSFTFTKGNDRLILTRKSEDKYNYFSF